MSFFQKRKEVAQKELAFERDNLWYFIPHYLRIGVLIFLVFVATFYGTSKVMCEDMGGYLSGSSLMIPECVPFPETDNYFGVHSDSSDFSFNSSNFSDKFK